jgi:dihydropteroate synthase
VNPIDFHRWLRTPDRPPLVMGVLNITPDSFSDGGRYSTTDTAIARAEEIAQQGADLIDVGGESTRPGSEGVEPDEQIRRVVPVLNAVSARLPNVTLSIDTTSSRVAEAALDAGAQIINDISAAREDEAMLPLAARHQVPIILMHMQGNPRTMQDSPTYSDVVSEVLEFLRSRIQAAREAGISEEDILLDPGIGFGKAQPHNLTLIREIKQFTTIGRPLVVGVSRKGFVGKITGEPEPAHRLFGTAACVAWCVANGSAILRVHDVRPMMQVVRMIRAIQTGQ